MRILNNIHSHTKGGRWLTLRLLLMCLLVSVSFFARGFEGLNHIDFTNDSEIKGWSGDSYLIGDGDDGDDDDDDQDQGKCTNIAKKIGQLEKRLEKHNCPVEPPQTCSFCGDGIVDPSEQCDDGNDSSTDACTAIACDLTYCGDGIVATDGNSNGFVEECDGTPDCNDDCILKPPSLCPCSGTIEWESVVKLYSNPGNTVSKNDCEYNDTGANSHFRDTRSFVNTGGISQNTFLRVAYFPEFDTAYCLAQGSGTEFDANLLLPLEDDPLTPDIDERVVAYNACNSIVNSLAGLATFVSPASGDPSCLIAE